MPAHLQLLLLRRQHVDDADPPAFGRQPSHLVALVRPPGLADVRVPVRAGASRGHVHKAPPGGVVPDALGQRVHAPADLRADTAEVGGAQRLPLIGPFSLTSPVLGSNQLLMSVPAHSRMGNRSASPAGRAALASNSATCRPEPHLGSGAPAGSGRTPCPGTTPTGRPRCRARTPPWG